MPFIIEGSDHLGKTTLANRIVEKITNGLVSVALNGSIWCMEIPAYYAHMSRPPKGWDFYNHYLGRAQPYAIQDRFHLGGFVYGSLVPGHGKISSEQMRFLNAHLRLMGSFTVVLYCSVEYDKMLSAKPKEEMYDTTLLHKANELWEKVRRDPDCCVDASWDVGLLGYVPNEVIDHWISRWARNLAFAQENHENSRIRL